MHRFNSLLNVLNDELQGLKDLQKLLVVEKAAITAVKQDKVDELQKSKSILLSRIQEYATQREGLVRSILQIEDAKKPAKASDVLLKCTNSKLKKQLQGVINTLRTVSAEVNEQNTYNSKLISHALGILSSSLAIVRSTPGTELPTYGDQGKLTSNVADPAFQKRKTLVTTA